jgi:hypothetical protein
VLPNKSELVSVDYSLPQSGGDLAPLGQDLGAVLFEGLAALEMGLMVEVIVDG